MISATIERADAFEWLGSLRAKSTDLFITDYAYESLEKHRKIGTKARFRDDADWFPVVANGRVPELAAQAWRVLKKNAHCYMFCDGETRDVLVPAFVEAGFRFWKALIWDKVQIGMGYHYRGQYENVLFFEKGKRRLNDLGISDILRYNRINKKYPTEKPVELLEVLVRQSSSPGEIVVDPFCGSGATARAALRNSRSFAGCDITGKAMEASLDGMVGDLQAGRFQGIDHEAPAV